MCYKKNTAAFVFIVFALLMLCSCSERKITGISTDFEVFVYEKCENVSLMTAKEDTLYTLESGEDNKMVLSAYNASGKQTARTVIAEYSSYDVKCICVDENKIYGAISRSGKFILCSFEINSGKANTLFELDSPDSIEKIGILNGKLYWIGQSQSEAKILHPFTDKDGNTVYYEDVGKKIGCVDLETGESVISEIDFPVSFSVSRDKVTVYAYDSEGGYYFTDYAAPSEKKYTNKLGLITNFEFFGENDAFAFIGASDFTGVLPVSGADSESGVIKTINGVYPFFVSDLCASESGYVWLKTADSAVSTEKLIKRYDLSQLTLSGDPIRIISSQYFVEQPFSAGSELQYNQLSSDGFALTVLSLDKSYDMAMISSEQGAANDVKEKGCFYPLNDVPGVSEYLDKCFPYIKDSVTDSEGNIMMLPIRVEIPIIVYNEKNCDENGIVFSTELEPFIQSVKKASSVSEYYACTRYRTVQTQLIGYLAGNLSFDTEKFRNIAKLIKEQCTEDIFKVDLELYSALMTMQNGMEDRYYTAIYNKTLFTQLLYRFQQVNLIKDENLRAAPLPLSANGKSVAVCTFLCVNPYSDRLSETLDYIEKTVNTMSSERNSCMLADPNTYENTALAQDMYSIYENGEIYFQIPTEIYSDDFDQYCNDEITLEEFIAEADLKLLTYLNE